MRDALADGVELDDEHERLRWCCPLWGEEHELVQVLLSLPALVRGSRKHRLNFL